MQAYKKDEESGVGQFFQDKTVSRSLDFTTALLGPECSRVLARCLRRAVLARRELTLNRSDYRL